MLVKRVFSSQAKAFDLVSTILETTAPGKSRDPAPYFLLCFATQMHAKSKNEREQALFRKERAINSWNERQPSVVRHWRMLTPCQTQAGVSPKSSYRNREFIHTINMSCNCATRSSAAQTGLGSCIISVNIIVCVVRHMYVRSTMIPIINMYVCIVVLVYLLFITCWNIRVETCRSAGNSD